MTTTQWVPMGETWPLAESWSRELSAESRPGILAWLDLLATWNARIDLTAARSPEELVDLMLADACTLAARVPRDASVVDVGAGAGAPGLALWLMRPDLHVRLVEPLTKRVAFLRTVLGTVGGPALTLERGRGEDVTRRGDKFDVAISRATLAPSAWLELGARLVREGGSVWVLLARESAPTRAGATIAEDVSYTWPNTGAMRRAVRYVIDEPGA